MPLQQKIILIAVIAFVAALAFAGAMIVVINTDPPAGGRPGGVMPGPVAPALVDPDDADEPPPGPPRSLAEITLAELRLERRKWLLEVEKATTALTSAQEALLQAQRSRDEISMRVDNAEEMMTQADRRAKGQLKRSIAGAIWRGDITSAAPSGPWIQKAEAYRELAVARRQYNMDEPRTESSVRSARDRLNSARFDLESARNQLEKFELELEKRERATP